MYSRKWIEKNLGITNKTIIYYENQGFLPKNIRNPRNNYREFDEKYINRLWALKVLRGLDFSIKEIHEVLNNPNLDFYGLISEKTEKLKNQYEHYKQSYEFANTLKLTGRIPTPKDMGNIKFDDFIEYSKENWNFHNNEMTANAMEFQCQDNKNLTDEGIDKLIELTNQGQLYLFHGYCKVLSSLSNIKHIDDNVQTIVNLIYIDFCEFYKQYEDNIQISKQQFAKHFVPNFFGVGDIAKQNEKTYGKEACEFMAKAVGYFGGYEDINMI